MSPTPPRFVPTLTDVVTAPAETSPPPDSSRNVAVSDDLSARLSERAMAELEARLVVGVMQRVDVVLERRIREAVGQVISEHSEGLAQRLREEIEQVVQDVVGQAVDVELTAVSARSPSV